MSRKVYVKLNIHKRKACLKRYVLRHHLKADSQPTVLSWRGILFHKVHAVLSKRRLPQVFVLVVGTRRSEVDRERNPLRALNTQKISLYWLRYSTGSHQPSVSGSVRPSSLSLLWVGQLCCTIAGFYLSNAW